MCLCAFTPNGAYLSTTIFSASSRLFVVVVVASLDINLWKWVLTLVFVNLFFLCFVHCAASTIRAVTIVSVLFSFEKTDSFYFCFESHSVNISCFLFFCFFFFIFVFVSLLLLYQLSEFTFSIHKINSTGFGISLWCIFVYENKLYVFISVPLPFAVILVMRFVLLF